MTVPHVPWQVGSEHCERNCTLPADCSTIIILRRLVRDAIDWTTEGHKACECSAATISKNCLLGAALTQNNSENMARGQLTIKHSGVARFLGPLCTPSLVGPQLKQKIGVCQNRPRYTVQKYVTAIHRRELVKNCGGWRSSAEGTRMEARRRRRREWGLGSGYPPLQWGWGLWPQKNFSILSLEMLNFYAFWTLEHGDSTASVIMMFMTSAHQCRIDRSKYSRALCILMCVLHYCKTLYFRCILIWRIWSLEISLHFNLAFCHGLL